MPVPTPKKVSVMKKLLLTSALVAATFNPVLAQSNADAAQFITGGIAMINAQEEVLFIGNQEVGSDNSLMLSDIKFTPESDVAITLDWIKMTPSSENSEDVIITMADTITIAGEDNDGPHRIDINTSNAKIVTNLLLGPQFFMNPQSRLTASITADNISFSGDELNIDEVNALSFSADDFKFGAAFTMATRDLDGNLSFDDLKLSYDIKDDYSDGSMKADLTYESFEMTAMGRNLPMDEDGLKPFIDENGEAKITFNVGATSFDMASAIPDLPMTIAGQTGPGAGEVSFIDGKLLYAAEGSEAKYTFSPDPSAGIPVPPFEVSVAGGRVNVLLPLRKSDEAQDAVVQMDVRDLKIDETIWGMVDPTGNLDHGPINLNIDLAANYRLDRPLVESLDEDGNDDVPSPLMLGQINKADINRIFMNMAGAMVDAKGGFTFDNSAGFPMPNGSVDISIEGITRVTDHLVQMGMLQEQDIAMAMGMISAFMKQGDKADSYSTTIKVDETGITANGTPLPF